MDRCIKTIVDCMGACGNICRNANVVCAHLAHAPHRLGSQQLCGLSVHFGGLQLHSHRRHRQNHLPLAALWDGGLHALLLPRSTKLKTAVVYTKVTPLKFECRTCLHTQMHHAQARMMQHRCAARQPSTALLACMHTALISDSNAMRNA